jgi:hypothetical protein
MSAVQAISYLAAWGITGAALFTLFVFFLFRTGFVYTARQEDGLLKEEIPFGGYLVSGGFLLLIVIFMLSANYFGLVLAGYQLSFWILNALNLGLYLVLFLFDTLVIDGLVIGYWRPEFLNLPPAMGSESMREHIKKSIPVGMLFGLFITLICSGITYYLFL